MEEEKVIIDGVESVEKTEEVKKEFYEYADVAIFCSVCKTDNLLGEKMQNVQGAIQFQPLTTYSVNHLTLACGNCGATLSLHFLPAANPPTVEAVIEGDDNDSSEKSTEETSV